MDRILVRSYYDNFSNNIADTAVYSRLSIYRGTI